MKKASLFMGLLVLLANLAQAQELKLNMRVLILAPSPDVSESPQIIAAQRILRGFGIPFDFKALADKKGNQVVHSLDLISSDGAGKYYGVIVTNQQLRYKGAKETMSAAMWEQLKNYERTYKVRHVSLFSNPATIGGMQLVRAGSEANNTVALDQVFAKVDPAAVGGTHSGISYNTHYPAAIQPGLAIYPVAHFGDGSIAGVHLKSSDGRELLHLFFGPQLELDDPWGVRG